MSPIKQDLPKLPLPPLKQTLERLLKSSKPFLTDEEYKFSQSLVEEFSVLGGEGEKLQSYLEDRVKTTENWLADLWLNHAYLEYRSPLPVYSNTANLHPFRTKISQSDQLAFAASVIAGVVDFNDKLHGNKLPIQKMGPYQLDMSQFYNLLESCRIPGEKRDSQRIIHYENPAKHIVVVHNCHFFSVPVYDDNGKALNQNQILSQLKNVVSHSLEISTTPVGIFTTEQRDNWYKIYTELKKDKENSENLEIIQSSIFVLCLDGPQKSPIEISASSPCVSGGFKMLHGGGSKGHSANRWYDKGLQIIVGANGEFGCSFEHSVGDGNPIAVLMDSVEVYSAKFGGKDDPVPPASTFKLPQLLQFNIEDYMRSNLTTAFKNIDRIVDEVELHTVLYSNYGKGFIKTQNISPDSYFQMAMQYAFYKLYNLPCAQYESAATRIFRHGRTETIRSCSIESVHFARTMLKPEASNNDKRNALRDAINSHKKFVGFAVEGQGVDRHLLGLRLMASQHGKEIPKLFQDAAYIKSTNMRLSTSQVPNQSGAYGFFGPLVPDGYGCCYTIEEEKITFAVSAFNSCKETSALKFSQMLELCLNNMKSMLVSVE